MPALYAHHIFGEQAALTLPEGSLEDSESLLAFLMGNQGPDPLFFAVSPNLERMSACHALASTMHRHCIQETFFAFDRALDELPGDLVGIGRAFVLGILAHYQLDRRTHPFVYAEQAALEEADPTLAEQPYPVHALIESDIDSWLVWKTRHATVAEYQPANELILTPTCARVANQLFSRVAREVFAEDIGDFGYAQAVRMMQRFYRNIEPAGSTKWRILSTGERLMRGQSQLAAMAHAVSRSDACPAANLEHYPWKNPATGEVSEASFADLFDEALGGYAGFAVSVLAGVWPEGEPVLDYAGRPVADS